MKSDLMCEDPHGSWGGRFYEHGSYIGHDEPSVRYISNRPGSGADTTFTERLPVDPKKLPTVKSPGTTSRISSSCRSRRGSPPPSATRTPRR